MFLTGHTGFKGSWLSLWLHALGARVTGFALEPPTTPSLFDLCSVRQLVQSIHGDIRDAKAVSGAMRAAKPEVVFHLAAQPLVRDSYKEPIVTYATNVLGTAHVLDAARIVGGVRAVVVVTTDKCYENREQGRGYREDDILGGFDPYSSSKACAELVAAAYRASFFNPSDHAVHGTGVATARAGNVIGGGDWAADRLVPDCFRAWLANAPILVRNPNATRPWQHVLGPLGGYLVLAEQLVARGPDIAGAWNFGPDAADCKPVEWVVKQLCARWGAGARYELDTRSQPREAQSLVLDCSKARQQLGWKPQWNIGTALDKIVEWTRTYAAQGDVRAVCLQQIKEYVNA